MTTVNGVETFEEKYAREKKEEKEFYDQTRALISHVCKILKFVPIKREDDSSHHVYMDAVHESESLHFVSGSYETKGRIRISGNFPRTEKGEYIDPYDYREKRHEITVSIDKSPEQIAGDIERRFLPRYRDLLARVIERVNKTNELMRACANNIELLKGTPATDEEKKNHAFSISGDIWGQVSVSENDARIELHSIPIEKAKRILEILK